MKKYIFSKGELVIYNNHLRIVDEIDASFVYFRNDSFGQIKMANIEFVSKIRKTTMREFFYDSLSEFYVLIPFLTNDEVYKIMDLIFD